MTIDKFNFKYGAKGGFQQLYRMVVDEKQSQNQVANHFGVTREGVRVWMRDLFNGVNVREERRVKRVEVMIDFMKEHSEYESGQAFKFENEEYYTEALFLAYKMGIYNLNSKTPSQHPDPFIKT